MMNALTFLCDPFSLTMNNYCVIRMR
nr:hypothetical protein B11C_110272 [Bartonella sp. 1-1C]